MPTFARDILSLGPDGLGWLLATGGLGGLIGALVSSSLGHVKYKGRILIAALISWFVLLGIFANLQVLNISLPILLLAGISRTIVITFIQLLLLTWSSKEMHGRMVGARMFAIGMLSVGNTISGFGAGIVGVPVMIMVNVTIGLSIIASVTLWSSELLKRE